MITKNMETQEEYPFNEKVDTNICSCCKITYNSAPFISINIGKHKLYLCPDCHKEYYNIVKRAYKEGQKNPTKKFNDWLYGC